MPSPSSSPASSVHSDPALLLEEVQTESQEALVVQADHCYSLLQSRDLDMDDLQSVRAEKPDTDVFIDLGTYSAIFLHSRVVTCGQCVNVVFLVLDDYVSEAMEEDFTTELPCTLSIEDTAQSISESSQTDQVRFVVLILKSYWYRWNFTRQSIATLNMDFLHSL